MDLLWKEFLDQITSLKINRRSLKTFDVLFSKYEKRIIAQRLAVLTLLRKGVGTREISRILLLSPTTVSTIKKNFFGDSGVYKSQRAFKKITKNIGASVNVNKHSRFNDILNGIDLWELIKNPPRPQGIGLKK